MATAKADKPRVHGSGGVYCGGEWLAIEDCGDWQAGGACGGEECKECPSAAADDAAAGALRAASNKPGGRALAAGEARACATSFTAARPDGSYDVAIIGAGCVGGSVARELSRRAYSVVLLEREDDVTQGATKGNSGIVHAGFDDQPGTNRARLCWKGNQMFPQLDRELK